MASTRENRWILGIAVLSLALRLGFAPLTDFGDDSIRLYAQALDLYLDGRLSAVGAQVVYSGTSLPGSLQQLLLALPLHLSSGMPWGPAVFIAFLNFLSSLLILALYLRLFPAANRVLLAGWILLAPWSILFTPVWNPSFLPLLSVLFCFALLGLFEKRAPFRWSVIVGLCLALAVQLHLSVVLLVAILAVCLLGGWIRFDQWTHGSRMLSGFSVGVLIGGISLLPWLQARLAPTDAGSTGFVGANIVFRLEQIAQLPMFLLRYLSFPTAEITRFASQGHGFRGAVALILEHWVLVPFALVALTGSLVLIWKGLRFLFGRDTWSVTSLAIKGRSSSTAGQRFTALSVGVPVIASLSFLFSIKGPSAHTFWILFPLSFYPAASELMRPGRFSLKDARASWKVWLVYLVCATIFSVGAYAAGARQPIWRIQATAQQVSEGGVDLHSLPPSYRQAVEQILRAKRGSALNSKFLESD